MWRGMNVSFRDMLFLLVFAYLVIGAVALAHVRKEAEEMKGVTPPGGGAPLASSSFLATWASATAPITR